MLGFRLSQKKSALGFVTVATAGALSLLISQGCTITATDAPLGDGGVYVPPGDDDGGGQASLGCSDCLFQGCRPQWAVCQNDTECRAIYDCSTQPGLTQDQITACSCAHPTAQDKYAALSACDEVAQCGSCATNCTATPASSCASPGVFQSLVCPMVTETPDSGITPPPDDSGTPAVTPATDAAAVADCGTCTASMCAAQTAACAAASDCDAFTLCTAACHDSACFDGCGTMHAQGKSDSAALNTCTTTSCAAPCGL